MLTVLVIAHIGLTVSMTNAAKPAQSESLQIATPADFHPGQTGLRRAGHMGKAGSSLAAAFSELQTHDKRRKKTREKTEFKPSNRFLQFYAGRVLVDARAADDADALLEELKQLGLENGKRYGDVISGSLPLAAIEETVALGNLRSISATPRPINHAGAITSQGDIALRTSVARSVFSVDGSGVTVGVVSDSYDTLGGAAADIVSGDLPAGGVTVLNGESSYCGTLIFCVDEGRAILQIIHDIAPGATLLFHTGLDGKANYANAITALATAGADIIVDDLLFLNEPMFQDGVVAQAVDTVVANGVAYFSAAGNQGRQSYEAAFVDSGEIFCIEFFLPLGDCHPIFERVGRMHDFDPGPGQDLYQSVTIPVNAVLTVAMQWDAPFGGAGPDNDHDIVLLDETGGTYYAISANDNIVTAEGWEVLQFDNSEFLGQGTAFSIIITYDDVDSVGPPANLVKIVFFGNGISVNEFSTDSATSFGHANAAGAEAVGAAFFLDTPEFGISPPSLESYSSAGGTPILFDTSGTPLAMPDVRLKPEITAVDGVNTTFFFNDSHGSDGIDDFFGTSAAAPHAAGVAALMLEARPAATPEEIKTVLESTAIDMGVAGFDHDSGYGLIQADLALAALVLDTDADGVPDSVDNCINVPNGPLIPDSGGHGLPQWDTDGDGYGNLCDPDFNGNGIVDPVDFSLLKSRFGQPGFPDQDLNGDGIVDPSDFSRFKTMFGQPPGPSGVAP